MTRLRRSIAYRLSRSTWQKAAIECSFETFKKNTVYLSELDLKINEGEHLSLLKGYSNAKSLVARGGIFTIENGHLYLTIDGVKVEIQTAEECFIANEIFVNRCYEFHTSESVIVLDIGMNVGMASLFFASIPNVEKVYSFEPFTPTYNQALVNLNLNPNLKAKIEARNIGWGDKLEILEVDYSPTNRGRVGIMGGELVKNKILDSRKEKMQIEEASQIVEQLLQNHIIKPSVVVKMDCEGAEYGIMENLSRTNLLGSFSMLMMEWHLHQPDEIVTALKKARFKLFKFDSTSTVGMIYAVR